MENSRYVYFYIECSAVANRWQSTSSASKAMIMRSSLEMNVRLERAGRSLGDFLEDDLSRAYLGVGNDARVHLGNKSCSTLEITNSHHQAFRAIQIFLAFILRWKIRLLASISNQRAERGTSTNSLSINVF